MRSPPTQVVLHGADGSTAEVYLFGGVCTSWKTGGRDVLYVRPDAKFDKSKPISVRAPPAPRG
jgi:glucose-6-phosphate 1-epimerase